MKPKKRTKRILRDLRALESSSQPQVSERLLRIAISAVEAFAEHAELVDDLSAKVHDALDEAEEDGEESS